MRAEDLKQGLNENIEHFEIKYNKTLQNMKKIKWK